MLVCSLPVKSKKSWLMMIDTFATYLDLVNDITDTDKRTALIVMFS